MTPEQKILKEFDDAELSVVNLDWLRPFIERLLKRHRQEIEKPFKHQKVMYQLGRKDALDEVRKGLPSYPDKMSIYYQAGWNDYNQEVLELLNKLK